MQQFFLFVLVGFIAQLIDGALGMAYGISSTTFLLALGLPPSVASASVHTAEVATTAVSGLSHLRMGNVDKTLFKRLVIPGVLGAVVGAYLLTALPGDFIKPLVSVYLLVMGILILIKAFRAAVQTDLGGRIVPLGLIGGFMDAIGGGGWGPIVVSTLVARGKTPRFVIGSTNLAEFFVAFAATLTFIFTIGLVYWHVIVGLAVGGILAAPLTAYITKHLPTKTLMILVGLVIILLSLRTIWLVLF